MPLSLAISHLRFSCGSCRTSIEFPFALVIIVIRMRVSVCRVCVDLVICFYSKQQSQLNVLHPTMQTMSRTAVQALQV